MAKMNISIFLLLTVLGTFIWNVVLVYLGAFFGASWETVAKYMNTYSMVATAGIAALALLFIVLYYFRRTKHH